MQGMWLFHTVVVPAYPSEIYGQTPSNVNFRCVVKQSTEIMWNVAMCKQISQCDNFVYDHIQCNSCYFLYNQHNYTY